MDGTFINLSGKDVELKINDKIVVISACPELVTPIKESIITPIIINGIISTPLAEDDIRYLHGTNWVNTIYNKITRAEEELQFNISFVNQYVKYPFTKEQIDNINKISNKRTRLFLVTEDDALYWSSGKFECPFRNYRLFVNVGFGLMEYPIPKTYLDTAIESVKKYFG